MSASVTMASFEVPPPAGTASTKRKKRHLPAALLSMIRTEDFSSSVSSFVQPLLFCPSDDPDRSPYRDPF